MIFTESTYHRVYTYFTGTSKTYIKIKIVLIIDAPIVVYIHGGYWQFLKKDVSAYLVEPLVSNGIKVIVVEYDLCPALTLSELIQQITRCGEFILNYADRLKSRYVRLILFS